MQNKQSNVVGSRYFPLFNWLRVQVAAVLLEKQILFIGNDCGPLHRAEIHQHREFKIRCNGFADCG